jgi:hypothetical protein
MGKKKRKSQQPVVYIEPTESEPKIHPDATLSPEAALEGTTTIALLQKDSTNAPIIGERESEESYVESWPGLADKYLLGKRSIPFSIILIISGIVMGFLFIQDNAAGLLININAITWVIIKSSIFFLVILVFWVVLSFVRWITNKVSNEKR